MGQLLSWAPGVLGCNRHLVRYELISQRSLECMRCHRAFRVSFPEATIGKLGTLEFSTRLDTRGG